MNQKKEFDADASYKMTMAFHHVIDELSIIYKLRIGDVVGVLESMKLELAIRHWMKIVEGMTGAIVFEKDNHLHR